MTIRHDDENPDLQAELRERTDQAALQVLCYRPILVSLMRSCVPEAGQYKLGVLTDGTRSLDEAAPEEVGPATVARCAELFGGAYLVRLPGGEEPIIFSVTVDQAGEDYPQGLMTKAEDEATQVIATAMQEREPVRKLFCLRVVVNPPEEYRHSVLRSVATAERQDTSAPADLCSVCLYAMGDPTMLPPLTAGERRSLLS